MRIKIRTILFWGLVAILYLLSSVIQGACDWFNLRFGVSFEEILFTITSPLAGSDVSFLDEAVAYVLPYIYAKIPFLLVVIFVFCFKNSGENRTKQEYVIKNSAGC